MAKVIEISYRKSQRIQLQQFEPVEVECSIKAEVKEGEDLNKAYTELQAIVIPLVQKEIVALRDAKQTKQELDF